jgi:hypothetical protein
METERGSSRSNSMGKSLWKRIWTYRKAEYGMNFENNFVFVKDHNKSLGKNARSPGTHFRAPFWERYLMMPGLCS